MLNAVKRNLGFVDDLMGKGGILSEKDTELLTTIRKLYAQQKEMFYEHKHRVENRIVSIAQPFIRPIVRGKAKAPVEFGAKYDVSINERGHARLEKATFEPYNEGSILCDIIERYRKRTGHYPARILVDKIYRTKANKAFSNEHRIEMSGRRVGRPPKDNNERRKLEKLERKNDTGRIEVERFFSLEKRCCGAGLIMTKLSETTLDEYCALRACRQPIWDKLPIIFFILFFGLTISRLPLPHNRNRRDLFTELLAITNAL